MASTEVRFIVLSLLASVAVGIVFGLLAAFVVVALIGAAATGYYRVRGQKTPGYLTVALVCMILACATLTVSRLAGHPLAQ